MKLYNQNSTLMYNKNQFLAKAIHDSESTPVAPVMKDRAATAIDLMGDLGGEGVILLLGFGMGEIATQLLRKLKPDHRLIIYENSPGVMKYAMERRNFSRLFTRDLTMLCVKEMDYTWMFALSDVIANGRLWVITSKASKSLNPEAYDEVSRKVRDEKLFMEVNVGTQLAMGKVFTNTLIRNIPKLLVSHGASHMRDKFPGIPGIIVSAGPSLDNHIEEIREAKGKAVIFAVDTAAPILMKNGIIPDFLCGIDPMEDNKALFKDERLKTIPFFPLAQYTPDVVKNYPGPLFFNAMPSNPVYGWLHWFWEDKGGVESFGGSVSHYATQVAEFLGCRELMHIGIDCSFKDKLKFHAGDITKMLHDEMKLEVPDQIEGSEVAKNMKGEDVYTKTHLQTFRLAFEMKAKACQYMKMFVGSEEGLPIKGIPYKTIPDFIKEYGKDVNVPAIVKTVTETPRRFNLTGLLKRINGAIDLFKDAVAASYEILDEIHKLQELQKNPKKNQAEIAKCVREIKNREERTRHPIIGLMCHYHFQLELYLKRHQVKSIDKIHKKFKWRKLELQVDRGLNFYGELIEAVDFFKKELEDVRDELEKMEGETCRKSYSQS